MCSPTTDTECMCYIWKQHWLCQCATMLCYMYIACLVNSTLMWLIARERFNALVHPKIFKSLVGINDLMCVFLFISGEINVLLVSYMVELYICYLGYFQRSALHHNLFPVKL